MKPILLAALLAVLSASAADTQKPGAPQDAASRLQQLVTKLERDVASLQAKVKELEDGLGSVQSELWSLEGEKRDTIALDVSSRAHQRLDTDFGSFLVSIEDVSPYLNGQRLKLNVGNLSYVTYRGFTITAAWGKKFTAGMKFADWRPSRQEKEISFTDTLLPGRWNRVDLFLVPASAEQLGFVNITMKTSVVTLVSPAP